MDKEEWMANSRVSDGLLNERNYQAENVQEEGEQFAFSETSSSKRSGRISPSISTIAR